MSNNLERKKQVVADIVKKFEAAKSVVIVKYSGLTVEQATALRAQCRASDVEYVVLKNTLVNRALEELKIEGLSDVLNGPSAFAFGMSDAVAPAKIINDFIVKNKVDALEIKAGLLDNEIMSVDKIKALAELPSREVLLARLLGSMTNTISSFVRVLDAIVKKQSGEQPAEA